MDNLNPGQNNVPNLGRYRIIKTPYKVLIPSKKRRKAYKLAPKTEPGRLLTVLSLKTFLIWVPIKRIMVKTPFCNGPRPGLYSRPLAGIYPTPLSM